MRVAGWAWGDPYPRRHPPWILLIRGLLGDLRAITRHGAESLPHSQRCKYTRGA
ncbi:hypothetical protein DB30_04368 [Enhygromyxa salina]|uniref:Uncharacterized protein n=1 Tax=Enhygromyxa salina TaxID=215803 RepID=A0A0C2D9C9_9BACT|nr:hypothetical protein DB30_04368 [Enhygromyxa salina]